MATRRLVTLIALQLLWSSTLVSPADLLAKDSCWSIKDDGGGETEKTLVAGKSMFFEIVKSAGSECKGKTEKDLALVSAEEKVANVQYIPTKQIYIRGVSPGRTSISILEKNRFVAMYDLVVTPDVQSLEKKVKLLFPGEEGIKISADKDHLTVYGTVSNPAVQTQILQLAQSYSPNKVNAFLSVSLDGKTVSLSEKLREEFPDEGNVRVREENSWIVISGCVNKRESIDLIEKYFEIYAQRVLPDINQPGSVDSKDEDSKQDPNNTSVNTTVNYILFDQKPKITQPQWVREMKIKNLLKFCDSGVQQVMLEVRIAEISRDNARRLGINLAAIAGSGARMGLSMLNGMVELTNNPVAQSASGGNNWTLFIDALKSNGLANVLAEPNLITISGQRASFLAGGEFPYEVAGANGNNTVAWKKFGVELAFTPTVLSGDRIGLVVNPKVSSLGDSIIVAGKLTPSLNSREVYTSIELADGQSFAIAGLLQHNIREEVSKFPVLGDVPILGALFRSSGFQKNETELIVIATPHLVRPLDADEQPLPGDSYVEPNDFEFYLKGSLEAKERAPKGGARPPRARVKGGLEGEFGHIVPE